MMIIVHNCSMNMYNDKPYMLIIGQIVKMRFQISMIDNTDMYDDDPSMYEDNPYSTMI